MPGMSTYWKAVELNIRYCLSRWLSTTMTILTSPTPMSKTALVKYATRRDGKWKIQAVDSMGEVAYPDRNGIAVDEDGHPYISYYDAGLGVLKLAHLNSNQKWVSEVVDENFAGFTSSLQIANHTIWLTYANESGTGLKFAYRPLDEAGPTAKLAPSEGTH